MNRRLAVLFACALAACGDAPGQWIDEARAANGRADALVAAGDTGRAAKVLEELVARRPPAGVATRDARVVVQDAYARLASLSLHAGRPSAALEQADSGLELGDGRDVFASRLRTLRGRALEALGRDADAARELDAAQAILEALLKEALADGGAQ